MRQLCASCEYYQPLGIENSGLRNRWHYVIGECTNQSSVHAGRQNVPAWNKCHLFQKRRKKLVRMTLLEKRARALLSGMEVLSVDDITRLVAKRRSGEAQS